MNRITTTIFTILSGPPGLFPEGNRPVVQNTITNTHMLLSRTLQLLSVLLPLLSLVLPEVQKLCLDWGSSLAHTLRGVDQQDFPHTLTHTVNE